MPLRNKGYFNGAPAVGRLALVEMLLMIWRSGARLLYTDNDPAV